MATIEEAIISLLESDAAVAAAAPGGVWPSVLPPAVEFPALRFLTVSDLAVMASDGPSGTHRVRMQLDAYGPTWPETSTLATAVFAALCPFPAARRVVGSVVIDGIVPELGRSGYETNTTLYSYSRDFIVWGGLV